MEVVVRLNVRRITQTFVRRTHVETKPAAESGSNRDKMKDKEDTEQFFTFAHKKKI